MIDGAVTITGDNVISHLQSLRMRLEDLRPVAEQIAIVLKSDNTEARLAGQDGDGQPLAPLAASTLKDRRRGSGPPLASRGMASKIITGFVVIAEADGRGHAHIEGGWPGLDWVDFQSSGAGRLPVRNVIGIRPEARAKIDQLIQSHISNGIEGDA